MRQYLNVIFIEKFSLCLALLLEYIGFYNRKSFLMSFDKEFEFNKPKISFFFVLSLWCY